METKFFFVAHVNIHHGMSIDFGSFLQSRKWRIGPSKIHYLWEWPTKLPFSKLKAFPNLNPLLHSPIRFSKLKRELVCQDLLVTLVQMGGFVDDPPRERENISHQSGKFGNSSTRKCRTGRDMLVPQEGTWRIIPLSTYLVTPILQAI